jgi:hypothetical protein
MSSGLCKKLKGAVFPFQVESLEDGVDDSVDAFYVDKANCGFTGSPMNFCVPYRLKPGANFDHPIFDPEANRKVLLDHLFLISSGK